MQWKEKYWKAPIVYIAIRRYRWKSGKNGVTIIEIECWTSLEEKYKKNRSQKAKIIASIIEWIPIKRMILHSLLNLSSFKPDLQLEAYTFCYWWWWGKKEWHQLPNYHMNIHRQMSSDLLKLVCLPFSIDSIYSSAVCGMKYSVKYRKRSIKLSARIDRNRIKWHREWSHCWTLS